MAQTRAARRYEPSEAEGVFAHDVIRRTDGAAEAAVAEVFL